MNTNAENPQRKHQQMHFNGTLKGSYTITKWGSFPEYEDGSTSNNTIR